MARGGRGTLAFLRPASPERLAELLALGFVPGEPIEILRTFPSHVFRIGNSQFAIDREMAAEIWVRPEPPSADRSG
jgi:DtxR family Mn-dependent transcriptional regulator